MAMEAEAEIVGIREGLFRKEEHELSGPIVLRPWEVISGTYFILIEPGFVKIGNSSNLRVRFNALQGSHLRALALLAWTNTPEKETHDRYHKSRVCYEFFTLGDEMLSEINQAREALHYGPIRLEGLGQISALRPAVVPTPIRPEWESRLDTLPGELPARARQILGTRVFRSPWRREAKEALVKALEGPDGIDLFSALGLQEWQAIAGNREAALAYQARLPSLLPSDESAIPEAPQNGGPQERAKGFYEEYFSK